MNKHDFLTIQTFIYVWCLFQLLLNFNYKTNNIRNPKKTIYKPEFIYNFLSFFEERFIENTIRNHNTEPGNIHENTGRNLCNIADKLHVITIKNCRETKQYTLDKVVSTLNSYSNSIRVREIYARGSFSVISATKSRQQIA